MVYGVDPCSRFFVFFCYIIINRWSIELFACWFHFPLVVPSWLGSCQMNLPSCHGVSAWAMLGNPKSSCWTWTSFFGKQNKGHQQFHPGARCWFTQNWVIVWALWIPHCQQNICTWIPTSPNKNHFFWIHFWTFTTKLINLCTVEICSLEKLWVSVVSYHQWHDPGGTHLHLCSFEWCSTPVP